MTKSSKTQTVSCPYSAFNCIQFTSRQFKSLKLKATNTQCQAYTLTELSVLYRYELKWHSDKLYEGGEMYNSSQVSLKRLTSRRLGSMSVHLWLRGIYNTYFLKAFIALYLTNCLFLCSPSLCSCGKGRDSGEANAQGWNRKRETAASEAPTLSSNEKSAHKLGK